VNITPGYYRTRGGGKARVLCTDAAGPRPVVGYICHETSVSVLSWSWCGVAGSTVGPLDLAEPWVEKPAVDWGREREWVKAVAMDQSGLWFRYEELPVADYGCGTWDSDGRRVQNMHPSEYPQFTGNWKDSLCVRPEGGAK
jgi:hypothetical protein